MKNFLLACLLLTSAHAQQYVLTFSGTVTSRSQSTALLAVGNTFTADLIVDMSLVTDTQSGNSLIGNYVHSLPVTISFSNGHSLSASTYDYVVVNDYYYEWLSASHDALAFYLKNGSGNINFGFEMRLPLGTFTDDSIQLPANPFTPVGSNWYYMPGEQPGLTVYGSFSSMSYAAIPEPGITALGAGAAALLFAGLLRRRRPRRQELHQHRPNAPRG